MRNRLLCNFVFVMFLMGLTLGTMAASPLVWNVKEDRVDADIDNWSLQKLLPRIARVTGWKVYVEPGTSATVSSRFTAQTSSQALRRLLDRLNYSLIRSNNVVQLYIYRSAALAATELVDSDSEGMISGARGAKNYLISNELVVRLKKGSKTSIDDLARQVGAKVIGRDDVLGIYRLQFESEEAAQSAKEILKNNQDVAWVDSNYSVDPPTPVNQMSTGGDLAVKVDNKEINPCSPIIGLIDTAIHNQPNLTNYILSPISVVGNVTAEDGTLYHADAMAGTMLRTNAARILPVVVYRNGTSTTTYEVALGVVAAITNHASIINLSLGGTGDSGFLKKLIEDATAQGVVFVAAAGNEPVTTPVYPAAWPGVISVTASDSTGHLADYANRGDFIKAMAPGTSYVEEGGMLWQVNGTSVAAANVSSMIAGTAGSDCASASSVSDKVISLLPVK